MRDYLVDLDAKVTRTLRITATDAEHAKREAARMFRAELEGHDLGVESWEAYDAQDDS